MAVDGSHNSEEALLTGVRMIRTDQGDELYIISVVETFPWRSPEVNNSMIDVHKKMLYNCACNCKNEKNDFVPYPILAVGEYAGIFLSAICEKRKIDLLIVGQRGRSNLTRTLTGSTARYVLEHCESDVLVVRDKVSRHLSDALVFEQNRKVRAVDDVDTLENTGERQVERLAEKQASEERIEIAKEDAFFKKQRALSFTSAETLRKSSDRILAESLLEKSSFEFRGCIIELIQNPCPKKKIY